MTADKQCSVQVYSANMQEKYNWLLPHYSTDITSQVSSTRCTCQVFLRVQPVSINHKVAIGKVSGHKHTTTATMLTIN